MKGNVIKPDTEFKSVCNYQKSQQQFDVLSNFSDVVVVLITWRATVIST